MRRLAMICAFTLLTACGGEQVTAIDPSNLSPMSGKEQSLMLAAAEAARQGNYAAAERDYLSAISSSTGHVDAHLSLAQLYNKTKQPQRGREVLTRALALQPKHPLANYLLGKLDVGVGDYEAALTRFKAGLESAPKDLDLLNGAGVASDMQGLHAQAQGYYNQGIRANGSKNLSAIRTNLAMSYLLSNDAKRALPLLKAEATKPDATSVTRHNLALAYGLLGNTAAARSTLKGISDEPTRIALLARIKEYLADGSKVKTPPTISPAAAQ